MAEKGKETLNKTGECHNSIVLLEPSVFMRLLTARFVSDLSTWCTLVVGMKQ